MWARQPYPADSSLLSRDELVNPNSGNASSWLKPQSSRASAIRTPKLNDIADLISPGFKSLYGISIYAKNWWF
ncbi:hypothetical protein A1507_19525 [Methylomonas koyamae]|uniref:Uncharacterized protein n=1 Tax=Methylomonas koyamae TaxID=702114 RepID=A0A177N3X2_9GAMM|nr:hypothetical protein A1507_19525 [Methylomonas koyamae]